MARIAWEVCVNFKGKRDFYYKIVYVRAFIRITVKTVLNKCTL